ncbi:hypothetical protein CP532_3447 [Ophiocordyceps camponoti-leonardi (nom. inval.)]|nr:hypothetical protein CP532_3447 [Ophiocordyceps camponoti-leonardi (nom. inval.)]
MLLLKPRRRAFLAFFILLFTLLHLATCQNNNNSPSSPPPSSSSSSVQPHSEGGPTPTSRPNRDGVDDRGSDATSSFDLSSSFSSSAVSDNGTDAAAATDSPSATNSSDSLSESPVSSSPADATATGGPMGDPKFINATIPAGQLPLSPEITPGWGVAGVIMLTTGITYTLVGIKNRWIHTFFSTAYITALGVAVLIIYVMNVPVSNAMQGGYVVAVVMSGCAVGAASMFFKELTEGLGCALGGFCVSMWLLCLVPGGLLRSVPAKAIFNASFTLVGFALYFSRWTRDWALIVTLAFSGATATILGLDCFSRAGLKEFWAYVWDVNGNLFPLGADTYPVTKGIRVETAAIIIICLVGIISQIKLWRIVRDKRAKRATERAEGQRNLELEEENVGRQVEEANARERRQWEQVYGNDTVIGTESRMSDLADTVSEKKHHHHNRSSVDVVDMSGSDMSRGANNPLMAAGDADEGKVMVRVGADDIPGSPPHDRSSSSPAEKRLSVRSANSKRASQAPEVVPLPFNVPRDDDQGSDSHRSSIATYAADDVERTTPHRSRPSLAKRLSRGSIDLLKGRVSGDGHGAEGGGESSDRLVALPKSRRRHDDNDDDNDAGSLAATVDGESASGDGRSRVDDHHACARSTGLAAELPGDEVHPEGGDQQPADISRKASNGEKKEMKNKDKQRAVSPTNVAGACPSTTTGKGGDYPAVPPSDNPKSIASVYSSSVNLTKDRLPRRISRVAMSYRTNEWAKHLGYAETPDPEELHLVNNPSPIYDDENNNNRTSNNNLPAEPSPTSTSLTSSSSAPKLDNEPSVPVNVVELQKTAEDGTPAPVMMRSESRASDTSYVPGISRRASRQGGASPSFMSPEKDLQSPIRSQGPVTGASPLRRPSSKFQERSVGQTAAEPIPEEEAPPRSASGPLSLEALQRTSLTVPGVVSYNSPQTLIGQREMFLRSKSYGSLLGGGGVGQEPMFSPPADAGGQMAIPPSPSPIMGGHDADDIPLSQRKDLMRHSNSAANLLVLPQTSSTFSLGGIIPSESTENLAFNSHQPKRSSLTPTPAAREAQLASFRQSVQQDLRSGTPIMNNSNNNNPSPSPSGGILGGAPTGRESVFTPVSLYGNRESEVQRNIEMQRNVLMGQKEAEAQRKEVHRREKEFADRAFDERMRSGDLLEAHREAMRKMQKGARD